MNDDIKDSNPDADNYGDWDEDEIVVAKRPWPYKPAWIALAGLALILALAWMLRPQPDTEPGDYVAQPSNNSAFATYRKALAEPDTGLRLFRLQNLIDAHPETREASYAKLQSDVLLSHETGDWQKVDTIFADKRATPADKRAAISRYQDPWRDIVRGTDIATRLEDLPEEAPKIDVTLDAPSPFAKGSAATDLAGGPVTVTFMPEVIRGPQQRVETLTVPNVVEARIRRSERPRYPKKALRRGIEATVVLSLNISAKGKVTNTQLVSVDAERYAKDFVKAAERAAKRTKFYPEKRNGRAVASGGFMRQFTFRLDE